MSLMNAWVLDHEALVAVDTEGVTATDAARSMSKVAIVPHMRAIIASRGSAAILAGVSTTLMASGGESFDQALEALPEILQFVYLTTPLQLQHPKFPDLELIVVGWSPAREKMVARIFRHTNGEKSFQGNESHGCIAPYDAETMDALPRTPDNLEAIARAQVRYLRKQSSLGGGELLVAHANRDVVSVRRVATLTEEEACRH